MNKQYKVQLEKRAQKSLKKMDKQNALFIMSWISKNLKECQDPYLYGSSLKGNLKNRWRYRVGNYRLICHIDDDSVTILILDVGHRKEIYDRYR